MYDQPWQSFTPARTGWTDVGTPTVTGRYRRIGHTCFVQVKVVPETTCAATAGTSYVTLPVAVGAGSLSGFGEMMNATTLVAVGVCVVDTANSRVYVPSQVATGNTLTIWAEYEV